MSADDTSRHRPDGRRIAIFGPYGPALGGGESFTSLLRQELARHGSVPWTYIDTSVSDSNADRGSVRAPKIWRVLRQLSASVRAATRGHEAYYPISQNRTGLIRDALLLTPFKLAQRDITVHLHGGVLNQVLPEEPLWLRLWLRWIFGGTNTRGIALTRSLIECLEPLVPRDRISVVANSVELPPDLPPKDPPPPLRVLFLSTLFEWKGYRELIEAVESVAEAGVSIEAEVAGESGGPDDSAWLAAVAPGLHATRILRPVYGRKKWELLARAHVVALPTKFREGQPMSIIEGMASGCAIVCTPQGGIPETVASDEALYVEGSGPSLVRALETALRQLADDPGLLDRLQAASRARYARDFAPSVFIERWLDAVVGRSPG